MNWRVQRRSGIAGTSCDRSCSGLPAHSPRSCPELRDQGPGTAGTSRPAFAPFLCLIMWLSGKGCCAPELRGESPAERDTALPAAWGGGAGWFVSLGPSRNPSRQARQACWFSRLIPEPAGRDRPPRWGRDKQERPLECVSWARGTRGAHTRSRRVTDVKNVCGVASPGRRDPPW